MLELHKLEPSFDFYKTPSSSFQPKFLFFIPFCIIESIPVASKKRFIRTPLTAFCEVWLILIL